MVLYTFDILILKNIMFNKYDRKGVYKLTCTNCNKFYIGRTNRNFNTRFKNIGKTSDMQKANPNSLNMSLTKDMK